ncbi:unnamed protein product [Rotaria magnacalcarata]
MRNKILNLPTARQSQVSISAATADIDNDQTDEPQNEPTTTTTVQERNKKEHACGNKLIVHYTHEKRFQTFKSDIHQVYDNVFKDTPAADVKLIVGNKNRRPAKIELICKRPKQSLLINKPLKKLEYVSGDLIPSHNRSIKPLSFILNDEHSDDDSTIEPNDLNLLVEMTPVVNSHLSTLPSDHRKSLSKRSSVARTHRNRKRNLTRRYSCY